MAQRGLLEWANSVRFTMANDPGRQFFQDQIQTYGFLFLNDYLDNILAGAKQDPLIELVKTPGRKKAVVGNGKVATATSKLKNVITLSLEDDDYDKENVPPLNNFHKALLGAKDKEDGGVTHGALSYRSNGKTFQQSIIVQPERKHQMPTFANKFPVPEIHEDMMPQMATSPSSPFVTLHPEPVDGHQEHLLNSDTDSLTPARSEQNELSVIAEDDESAERSRVSIQISHQEPVSVPVSRPSVSSVAGLKTALVDSAPAPKNEPETKDRGNIINPATDAYNDDMAQAVNSATPPSMDTFHSMPQRDSKMPKNLIPAPRIPQPSRTHSPAINKNTVSNAPPPTYKPTSGNFTAPLPEIPPWHPRSTHQNDAMTAPLPTLDSTLTVQDVDVPLMDASPTSPNGLTHKLSVPLFPSLPAPMPLRKSMRAPRDPSMGVGPTVMGAATPGAVVGGKRTSWLMKVREAKAMEVPVRKTSTLGSGTVAGMAPPVPGMASGMKRKSGDMLGAPEVGEDDDERRHKATKNVGGDVAPLKPKSHDSCEGKGNSMCRTQQRQPSPQPPPTPQSHDGGEQEGMLDRFKRTVEGLGARVGKSMGKSLGGAAAANALADARAAAEARVAERNNKEEEMTMAMGNPAVAPAPVIVGKAPPVPASSLKEKMAVEHPSRVRSSGPPKPAEWRLSVSDLVAAYGGSGSTKGKDTEPGKVFQLAPFGTSADTRSSGTKVINVSRESTTTTPPDSPPPTRPTSFLLPSGPVFNKPPPVFVPPALAPSAPANQTVHTAGSARDFSFNLPASTTFSMPASMSLGLAPRLPSPSSSSHQKGPVPLSAQSTLESVMSDALFDRHDDDPAWMPTTQDTEYTSGFGSQSQQLSQPHGHVNELDEDDSWPMDEKLSGGVQWTFGTGMNKEDSLTWSTLPTESQRADTGPVNREQASREREEAAVGQTSRVIPGVFDMDVDEEYEGDDDLVGDSEFDEMEIEPGKSTVSLVESKVTGSQSQLSIASPASSQSHGGFLGHASKLVSSVLGTSKKGKPEVKSLQLAAVAAKKHQEDKDKKAARLKEMENRRQLALQRKTEEEKARAFERERKIKEDGERRKREREEHTDKRPLKGAASKKVQDEENTKKRKVVVEIEKKPASKILQPSLNTSKTTAKPAFKQSAALSSSAPSNASLQTVVASTSTVKAAVSGSSKTANAADKGKGKAPIPEDDISQPSRIVQTQMAARAKAQLQAAKQQQGGGPTSESIELPDINSEYSDSDDDDRPRTFDPPGWAQSPELRQALEIQSTINPDDIFGAIRPLRMEELFRTRTSRFRARTSSANWTGTDRLTVEEQREYAKRMGYR